MIENENVEKLNQKNLALTLLVFFSERDDSSKPCPENTSSFPSVITFSWFDSLAWTGYKRTIVDDDLWQLNPRDQSATTAPIFDANWGPKLKAANLTSREKTVVEEVTIETGKKKTPKESKKTLN